ncbi:MAG: outer membrane beta-barrel protein [Rhizobiaceae bacterium]
MLASAAANPSAYGQEANVYVPGSPATNSVSSEPEVIFTEPIGEEAGSESSQVVRNISDPDPSGRNLRVNPVSQVGLIGQDGAISPLANTRVLPDQSGSPRASADPYAALGLRVGTFTLFPVLTQTFGVTSNADFSAGGAKATFSQTDLRLRGVSNWSRHQLRGEVGLNHQKFFNGASDDIPAFNANLELRLDLAMDWVTRFGVNGDLSSESAISDNISVPFPLSIVGRPKVKRFGSYAEIEKQSGFVSGLLRGSVSRAQYDSASVSDGSVLSQDDRNNILFELLGRVNFRTSSVFQPFVEGRYGLRTFDLAVDRNGNNRDSVLYNMRLGLAFNRGEKINGQFSVGYGSEVFADPNLTALTGLTIDGSVNWSPVRLTTITATAQTSFSGSTNVNESGSITHAGSLGIARDVRANLSINGRVLASLRRYDSGRQDKTYQAQVGAEWRLNRNASLFGNVGYELVNSTDIGSSYNSTIARIGLRLQK